MAKKFRNLIQRIVSDDNIRAAYNRTSRAKRMTFGYLEFKEFAEVNLARLAFEIQEVAALFGGNWSNGANAGARASYWYNYPWGSSYDVGARGRCDHLRLA